MSPKNHQKLPSRWEKREQLRNKGQFWTPDWVAKPMVKYVIGSGSPLVLDPATGNGAFLEAWEKLHPNLNGSIFFGLDIDSSLLDQPIYKKPYCRIKQRDFVQSPPIGPFSSIVANPPYIRHHRLSADTKHRLREIAIRNIGSPLDGRAGIHVYFLVQALSLLGPASRLSFIMPADTCEGVFAPKLWKWITSHFRLDAVITFDSEATPFPGVDTNAMVFMIQKKPPKKYVSWIRCNEAYCEDLYLLVESGFRRKALKHVDCRKRELQEALSTGLSRPPCRISCRFMLSHFASVMRGIATGANEFFWLTKDEAEKAGIPQTMLKVAIGRTRDVKGDCISKEDIKALDKTNRPTLLFCPDDKPVEDLPPKVQDYLHHGEAIGLNERALIGTRRPWYKMEYRDVPPLLFAYLGRRNTRFIRNEAKAVPLTGFLCIYPHSFFKDKLEQLWEVLNDPETIANLSLVGKSYGSGAIKVEPRSLERLPIPDRLAKKLESYPLKSDKQGNLLLFEKRNTYRAKRKAQ